MRPVYFEDGELKLIDQTLLPTQEIVRGYTDYREVADAIVTMVVRGAPAIGVTAGYAVYLASKEFEGLDAEAYQQKMQEACDLLRGTRPTAVNLFWAIDRMSGVFKAEPDADPKAMSEKLKAEADAICEEDIAMCKAMGKAGAALIKPGSTILTHCNAGILATAGYGTALAPLHLGQERGYGFKVYADETRPLLQGARLTAWELMKSGVDVTLICDNMSSLVMKKGLVDAVVVGCDRMAANGDGANKIGTSALAVLAKEYGIPFYMFVPTSTIDLNTPSGDEIVIEEREGSEIYKKWYSRPMAPAGVKTFNPAFDVTDHKYITAVVTEKGVIRPPYDVSLREIMGEK